MKKLLKMVVALAVTACLTLGISACDQKGEKLPEEGFEEIWANAFSRENFFNCKFEMKSKYIVAGEVVETMSASVVGDNRAERAEMVRNGADGKQEYAYYFDGSDFFIKKEAGWEEPPGFSAEAYEIYNAIMGPLERCVFSYANRAGVAEYNEGDGSYSVVIDESEETEFRSAKCTFIFKNQKVVKTVQSYVLNTSSYTASDRYEITYEFTYGEQEVTPPKGLPETDK